MEQPSLINDYFQLTQKYKTQKNILDDYKLENNILCNNTSFYKKESKIPLEYYENIYICGYTINNTGKVPFQRFLLINSLSNRMLAFPTVKLFKKFNDLK